MASSRAFSWVALALLLFVAVVPTANGDDLSPRYYDKTCPNVQRVVRSLMAHKVAGEPRMAPAVLRLFFHDCFVNVRTPRRTRCPTASLAGFEVIDEIKSLLEHDCPATVFCADIIALASRDAVAILEGPTWNVPLGRRDSRSAAEKPPHPREDNLGVLIDMSEKHGLDARDMTALSGAHTVGMASCENYEDRTYGTNGDADIDPSFAETARQTCQGPSGDGDKASFDAQTPMKFDNAYYLELIARRGLLTSDQTLYGGGGLQDNLVEMYSVDDGEAFGRDFAKAMVKMGNIPPPKGMPVEVRLKCSVANW
ncbi:hypothetical protein ACQ4PT_021930 [Festuca glaucescens]